MIKWIANLFKPAADLVDNLHTSKEEKLELKNKLAKIQQEANAKFIELELAKVKAQSEIIKAEAMSNHWLVANWRPICSITIVGLIVLDGLGLATVSNDIYQLATVFLGVYAGGRSLEKTAKVSNLGK